MPPTHDVFRLDKVTAHPPHRQLTRSEAAVVPLFADLGRRIMLTRQSLSLLPRLLHPDCQRLPYSSVDVQRIRDAIILPVKLAFFETDKPTSVSQKGLLGYVKRPKEASRSGEKPRLHINMSHVYGIIAAQDEYGKDSAEARAEILFAASTWMHEHVHALVMLLRRSMSDDMMFSPRSWTPLASPFKPESGSYYCQELFGGEPTLDKGIREHPPSLCLFLTPQRFKKDVSRLKIVAPGTDPLRLSVRQVVRLCGTLDLRVLGDVISEIRDDMLLQYKADAPVAPLRSSLRSSSTSEPQASRRPVTPTTPKPSPPLASAPKFTPSTRRASFSRSAEQRWSPEPASARPQVSFAPSHTPQRSCALRASSLAPISPFVDHLHLSASMSISDRTGRYEGHVTLDERYEGARRPSPASTHLGGPPSTIEAMYERFDSLAIAGPSTSGRSSHSQTRASLAYAYDEQYSLDGSRSSSMLLGGPRRDGASPVQRWH